MTVERDKTAEEFSSAQENVDMSVKEFNDYLFELIKHVESDFYRMFVDITRELWKRVVNRTPVDTGLAQNNWQLDTQLNDDIKHKNVLEQKKSLQYPRGRILPNPTETGVRVPPIPSDLHRLYEIWLFNNLEYIDDLEMGLNGKVTAGMLAKSLAEAPQIFDKVGRKYGYVV